MAINKKVLGRLSRRFLSTPKFTESTFRRENTAQKHLAGSEFGRRVELKLFGKDATAVRGEPGSRVRLNVEGIITSAEGGPRERPNKVVAIEAVSQSRRGRK